MKSLIIICSSLIILFSSCQKSYQDTYTVINDTNKQVKIEGYAVKKANVNHESFIYNETIDIQPNSKFSILKSKGESWDPKGIFISESIDSVNIIFDNQRIIKYACYSELGGHSCNDKRNILNYLEFYDEKCNEHECTYTYTITEADFESAEIIK